jgi:hypothetical protein
MALLSTGKSVSDHAISAAAKKDCAVWRVVKDEEVCREYKAGEKSFVVAEVERWEHGSEFVGLTEPEPFIVRDPAPKPVLLAVVDPVMLPQFADDDGAAPPRSGVGRADGGLGIRMPKGPIDEPFMAIAPSAGVDLVAQVAADAPWILPVGLAPIEAVERAHEKSRPPEAAPDRVLVLGSFASLDNAKRIARLWSGFHPAIVRTRLGGGTYHRVIMGSLGGDVDRRRRQIASLGQQVWAADVCAEGRAGQGCVVLPAVFRR